jgi:hypothetical protein
MWTMRIDKEELSKCGQKNLKPPNLSFPGNQDKSQKNQDDGW